jgi:hypothetical protein
MRLSVGPASDEVPDLATMSLNSTFARRRVEGDEGASARRNESSSWVLASGSICSTGMTICRDE